MESIKLSLPLPPKATHPNARANWQAKATAIAKQRGRVGEAAAVQVLAQLGMRPKLRHAIVQLYFELPRPKRGGEQKHDPDNLIAWAKATIDGLTDAGILADDRELIYAPPSQRRRTKKEDQERPFDSGGALTVVISQVDFGRCLICGGPRHARDESPPRPTA